MLVGEQLEVRTCRVHDISSRPDLVAMHYAEVEPGDAKSLDPDWPAYEALEQAGRLVVVGAFECDSLVGYSMSIVTGRHLHRDVCAVHNDSVFVRESHRRRLGLRLLRASERAAREAATALGFARCLFSVSAMPGSRLAELLPKAGYRVQETVFLVEVV